MLYIVIGLHGAFVHMRKMSICAGPLRSEVMLCNANQVCIFNSAKR